jgi:abhydrolase domain-containing protein 14
MVVLLHGQAFDAATWQRVGTLAALGERGIRAIAVDLPGHGITGGTALNGAERAAFLEELLTALHAKQQLLVLVTPSMSGTYVLGWLADHAAELKAWVAVAPAGLKQWIPKGVLASASKQPKVRGPRMAREGRAACHIACLSLLGPTCTAPPRTSLGPAAPRS